MFRHAAHWLRLGHTDRLLAYAWPEDTEMLAFLTRQGLTEITRTRKGWTHPSTTPEPVLPAGWVCNYNGVTAP